MGDPEDPFIDLELESRPEKAAPEREMLRSWKEIAAYLKVSVRAAQVWEKEKGLPVRRLGSAARSPVVADSLEIDRWVEEQTRLKAQANGSPSEAVPVEILLPKSIALPAAVQAKKRIPLWAWVSAAGLLLIASLAFSLLRPLGVPSRLELEQKRIKVIGEKGELLWEKYYPNLHASFELSLNETRHYLVADIDQDGSREVLCAPQPEEHLGIPTFLICFSNRGEARWEFPLGHEKSLGDRKFGVKYILRFLFPVESHGKNYLLSIAGNTPWFPAQVALLDAQTGRLIDEYWHPGHITAAIIRDIDKDGIPEAILGGFNHPGPGLGYPALAVLKIPFVKRSPPADEPSYSLRSFSGGQEYRYFLLPRTDITEVLGTLTHVSALSADGDNQLQLTTFSYDFRYTPTPVVSNLIYKLNSGFRILDLWPPDNHYAQHEELFRAGRLNHEFDDQERRALMKILSFPVTPNGNAPDIAALWSRATSDPSP